MWPPTLAAERWGSAEGRGGHGSTAGPPKADESGCQLDPQDDVARVVSPGNLLAHNASVATASSIAATGSRLGLANMRDRVEALGGTLAAGPDADGGFFLRVRLPLAPAPGLAAAS